MGCLKINSCRRSRALLRPVTQTYDLWTQCMTRRTDLPLRTPSRMRLRKKYIFVLMLFGKKTHGLLATCQVIIDPKLELEVVCFLVPGGGPHSTYIATARSSTAKDCLVFVRARTCSVVLTCSALFQHVSVVYSLIVLIVIRQFTFLSNLTCVTSKNITNTNWHVSFLLSFL